MSPCPPRPHGPIQNRQTLGNHHSRVPLHNVWKLCTETVNTKQMRSKQRKLRYAYVHLGRLDAEPAFPSGCHACSPACTQATAPATRTSLLTTMGCWGFDCKRSVRCRHKNTNLRRNWPFCPLQPAIPFCMTVNVWLPAFRSRQRCTKGESVAWKCIISGCTTQQVLCEDQPERSTSGLAGPSVNFPQQSPDLCEWTSGAKHPVPFGVPQNANALQGSASNPTATDRCMHAVEIAARVTARRLLRQLSNHLPP
jgi:hypothetical protein